MAIINWNDSYSVGVEVLDEQHKQLVKMINSMHGKYDQGVMFDVIMQMFNYAAEHFKTEETLLRKRSFNGLERQVREHKMFMRKASDFAGKNLADPAIHAQVVTFLSEWLVHHILHEDMQYREILSLYEDDDGSIAYSPMQKL
jgi:hemerythrin-like metal-binding protein